MLGGKKMLASRIKAALARCALFTLIVAAGGVSAAPVEITF